MALLEGLVTNALWLMLCIFIIMFVRGWLSEMVAGLLFRIGNKRKEQEIVFYKDREARITKIGLINTTLYMFDRQTVLQVRNRELNGYLECPLPKQRMNGK